MCGYRRLLRVTPHRVTSWQTKMLTYFSRFRQFLYHYEVTLHHLMPCFCWSNLILATFFRHIHPDIHPEKMCGVWPCKWETMGYLHLQIWWSQATWIIYSMNNTWEKWWNSAILAVSEWGKRRLRRVPQRSDQLTFIQALQQHPPLRGWPGWNDLICTPT